MSHREEIDDALAKLSKSHSKCASLVSQFLQFHPQFKWFSNFQFVQQGKGTLTLSLISDPIKCPNTTTTTSHRHLYHKVPLFAFKPKFNLCALLYVMLVHPESIFLTVPKKIRAEQWAHCLNITMEKAINYGAKQFSKGQTNYTKSIIRIDRVAVWLNAISCRRYNHHV